VVTVHDPDGRQGLDVLDGGPERPACTRRRQVLAAVALAAVVGLVAGGLELKERRTVAAEQRRAAAAVDVVLLPDIAASSSSSPRGGSLRVDVLLRNAGPREVEVTGASWAGFALVRPVRVSAGEQRQLSLAREVVCSPGRPAVLAVDDPVALQVRTTSTVRTVQVPFANAPLDAVEAERMCGFYPLEEALFAVVGPEALPSKELVLQLGLSVRGSSPVDVVSLDAGDGLLAVLRDPAGGKPVRLPVALEVGEGRTFAPTTYEVAIIVADCAAVRPVPDEPGLALRSGDGKGRTAEVVLSYEASLRAGLIDRSCPR
jgi:hypothetical protein